MTTCTVNPQHELHADRAGWTTCRPCEDWIRDRLDDVEQLWPALPDCLERSRGHTGPRVSGATRIHAPLPLDDHALTLIGPGGAHDRLGLHDAAIRTARGLHGAPVTGSADYRMRIVLRHLRDHLAWAAANIPLGPLAVELRTLVGEMRAVTGDRADTTPITTQRCPAPGPAGAPCGGQLHLNRDTRTITCTTCDTDYTPQALALIAAQHTAPAPETTP